MACLKKLKEDITRLEQLFPRNHERLQVCRGLLKYANVVAVEEFRVSP